MTGGAVVQLTMTGQQDAFLTLLPLITWFLIEYKQYTEFAMEPIEVSIDSARFGNRTNTQILRNADLATRTYMHVTLPELTAANTGFVGSLAWVRKIGHALVRSVELQIGGAQIDKHWGVWLDVLYELTHTEEQMRGYAKMIGDVPELTTLTPGGITTQYELFIPLQFWFNRNYGLALPLIALQYHEVRLYIEFETMDRLVNYTLGSPQLVSSTTACGTATCGGCLPVICSTNTPTANCNEICVGVAPTFSCATFCYASLLIDYVYLGGDERRRFAQYGHEYLFEELQYPGPQTLNGPSTNPFSSQSIKLDFNHPVKELIWVPNLGVWNGNGCNGSVSSWLAWAPYLDTPAEQAVFLNQVAANLVNGMLIPPKCTLSDSGDASDNLLAVDPCCPSDASTYSVVSLTTEGTYKTVIFTPTTGGTHQMTVRFLLDVDPTGSETDYSYISTVQVGLIKDVLMSSGGINLADFVNDVTVVVGVSWASTSGSATNPLDNLYFKTTFQITVNSHSLSMANASIPLCMLTDNRCPRGKVSDVYARMPFNYGLTLAGNGLFVKKAKVVINGNDRYAELSGAYHNYVQPWQHHTHTPADGVNHYSFSLRPEPHQPSGTCNFSRIDTAHLKFTTQDDVRYSAAGTLNANTIPLDVFTGTVLHVFATDYNVLRIVSGMGGKSFAS